MNYKDSGVGKERGYELVRHIQENARETSKQPNILGGIGGFASLYALHGYREPVLVSGADGIGTKLKLAFDFGIYDSVGQDCVAMCVNDILCAGAQPLFFLDYLACEHLDVEIASKLVQGISWACSRIDIPLLGGETAEMPGFYKDGLYDIAGFCLGVVERSQIRGRERSQVGDVIIGLASNGLHSNGFSLVRKVLAEARRHYGPIDYGKPLIAGESGKKNLRELLLQPTTIYAQLVGALLDSQWGEQIHAMAHISGGGIYENLPRALGLGQCAEIERKLIDRPEIFSFVQDPGRYLCPQRTDESPLIGDEEMWHTFNMGLGFAIIVAEDASAGILQLCRQPGGWDQQLDSGDEGLWARVIGRVCSRDNPNKPQVQLI